MKSYLYTAYDNQSLKQQGQIYATDLKHASQELNDRQLTIITLSESQTQKKKKIFSNSANELELVTAELALLLNNGMRIDRALELLIQAGDERQISDKLNNILTKIRSGAPLAQALKDEPKIFDQLFIALVDLGEKTGRLGDTFKGLSANLQFRKKLKKKITQALTYPTLILGVCISAILFIFNIIIPRMSTMFEEAAQLPLYTEIMLGFSSFIQKYQLPIIFMVPAVLFLVFCLKDRTNLNPFLDAVFLRMPIIKKIIIKLECIRFSSAMALTLKYGINLEAALQLAAMTIKNNKIQNQVLQARQQVRQGNSLSSALLPLTLFPPIMQGLLSAGEESATLPEVFTEVTKRSRDDFEDWVAKFTSLLEPLMIVVMGGIVGTIVIVMLLSIIAVQDISF